ncbi:MAG: tyrosine-type recombinase/integrase [Actinomycetota bacterium]
MAEASTGRHTGAKATMDDLCGEWLVELERKNRKPTTIYNYERRYRHDIQPTLGRTQVRKVTPKMVSDLLLAHQRRGVSAGSVGTIHIVLSSMLTQACRWGWRDDNPARWIEKPSRDDVVPIVPTPEEVRALIEAARQSKRPEYARFFLLSATTGLRRGEMCGMRFTDIDQETGVLTVRTGITHVPGRPRIEGSSKNRRMRAVALGPRALGLVEAQRKLMLDRAAEVEGKLDGEAFVFSDAADGGVPWRPDSTTQYFTRLRSATDVRQEVKLKHLRKFMETYGQSLGFSLADVALRAGHDPAVAGRFYTGRVAESDYALASEIESLLDRP